jgi:hypothetical protein
VKAMRTLRVGLKAPRRLQRHAARWPESLQSLRMQPEDSRTRVSSTQLEPCNVHTAPSAPIHVGAAVGNGADAFPEEVRFSKDGARVACIGAQDPPACARLRLKPTEARCAAEGRTVIRENVGAAVPDGPTSKEDGSTAGLLLASAVLETVGGEGNAAVALGADARVGGSGATVAAWPEHAGAQLRAQ